MKKVTCFAAIHAGRRYRGVPRYLDFRTQLRFAVLKEYPTVPPAAVVHMVARKVKKGGDDGDERTCWV